jgi:hypothetical protein
MGCLYKAAVTVAFSRIYTVVVGEALKIEYEPRLALAGRATLLVAVALTAVTVSAPLISSAMFTARLEGFKLTSPIV